MSTPAGKAYHPTNGSVEEIWEGFSWPCLFLGFVWFAYKGMWDWAVISVVLLGVVAAVFFPLVFVVLVVIAFAANELHARSLMKRGYLNESQWRERQSAAATPSARVSSPAVPASLADELAKLAKLREQGVLSNEEFELQKIKLLS